MRMTTKLLVAVVVAPLAVLGLWLVIGRLQESSISLENYKRIELGMTRLQVVAILGQPRREVGPADPKWIDSESVGNALFFPDEWWGECGVIQVWYIDDIVSDMSVAAFRCEVAPISWWGRLRRIFLR